MRSSRNIVAPSYHPGRLRRRGFTLVEMLLVVAMLAVVAGAVTILASGISQKTDAQLVQAECAEIRKAVRQFDTDMGYPPQRIAELIQSPDPADTCGGWWWRTDEVPERLWTYDPATRRGWDGPYLHSDFLSDATEETAEANLTESDEYDRCESDNDADPAQQLTILLSRYATYPQMRESSRLISHYQLDFSDSGEVALRFVGNPLAEPDQVDVIARMGLGVRP